MFDLKAKIKGPPIAEQLVNLRRAQVSKKHAECYGASRKLAAKSPGLKTWLAVVELDCALKLAQLDGKDITPLVTALAYVDQNPRWLLNGPQVPMLKPNYLEGQLVRFERQIKNQRRQAWNSYDVLQQWVRDLNADQKARMYRAGGELAFVEQNVSLAVDLYSRSLSEKESADVRRRLDSVRAALSGKKEEPKPEAAETTANNMAMVSGEKEISDRMELALKSGDLISAVEDGVKLIEKIPGSTSAKWAGDRILEVYLSLGAKAEGNYPTLRERAVEIMVRADATRLFRWANNAYVKSFYKDAQRLSEAAVNKYGGQPDSTKAILLAANSAFYAGDLGSAERWFERLTEQHGGSDESRQAMFRLGLIRLRAKKYADASAYFERLLSLAPGTDWEYLALHWHWRAQQKLKGSEVKTIAERLISKYPLTYYGLRARAELNNGLLTFATPKPAQASSSAGSMKSELWLTETQSQAWERLQLLLRAGWFDEAQAELEQLPEPLTAEDKLVRARLFATAFDHYDAVRLFNDVWTKRPDLFQWSQAKSAFPFEFQAAITQNSKSSGLDEDLIRGLIRQESTFRPKVTSTANAMGVMQVLPATAQEVAQMQRWKPALVLPDDLFNPDINIRIGSAYLARLVKAYKGHVPLSLAAYNAGTGRLRKWLAARADLGDIEGKLSSAPEDEMWIDELPWDETCSYVKAILRNLLIYQMIGKGEVKLANPLWQIPQS